MPSLHAVLVRSLTFVLTNTPGPRYSVIFGLQSTGEAGLVGAMKRGEIRGGGFISTIRESLLSMIYDHYPDDAPDKVREDSHTVSCLAVVLCCSGTVTHSLSLLTLIAPCIACIPCALLPFSLHPDRLCSHVLFCSQIGVALCMLGTHTHLCTTRRRGSLVPKTWTSHPTLLTSSSMGSEGSTLWPR